MSARSRRWWRTRSAPTCPATPPTARRRGGPDMTTTEGIGAVFLETHNWGRSAKFFQALGFTLELETGHGSGLLRNGDGAYVFVAEIPEDRAPGLQVMLDVV